MPPRRLSRTARKWLLVVVGLIAFIGIGGAASMHFAARSLKQSVVHLLGPESTVEKLTIGLTRLIMTDVRVKGPEGWPAETALSAERVVIVPDIRRLLSGKVHVTAIMIENGYISALRPREGGGLKVLPGILGKSGEKKLEKKMEKRGGNTDIQAVELRNCTVELFDATVSNSRKMRIDAVAGTLGNVRVPDLESRINVDLQGGIKGGRHLGSIGVEGWINVAQKSSELEAQVRNVDLALFEPQLIQKVKAGIDRGTFNLDIHSSVRNNVVDAHGVLELTGLKLKTGKGAFGGLSNIPRRAVIGALADEKEKIALEFKMVGDLDNPGFSLTEGLGLRTATALLKGLGLGFEGLVRAFFVLINGFGSAFR